MSTATLPALTAVEILASASFANFFALLSDGTYRWLSDDMRLIDGGPNAGWVERMRTITAASRGGRPNVERPLAHDVLLATLNERLRGT